MYYKGTAIVGRALILNKRGMVRPEVEDPLSMGEDLAILAERLTELAEIHCVSCDKYHTGWIKRRIAKEKTSFYLHMPELPGAIFHAIGLLHERNGGGNLNILIAGSADTGLLALCAHITRMQRLFERDRVRLHVIDGCQTPLILCEEFGARHGVRVTTRLCQMPAGKPGFVGNLIVAQNLLGFVPVTQQPQIMRFLSGAHEPGGILVYAHTLTVPEVFAPQNKPGLCDAPDGIRALLAGAGYEFEQETVTDRSLRLKNGQMRHRRRYIVVCRKVG